MSNKNTYQAQSVVKSYVAESDLQEPEKTILKLFENSLKEMRMLDIGVGGGRTTVHFAGLAKQYVGTDYAENMITACRKRFPEASENISFEVCDARSMTMFEDNYFDFILCSYNGLDYISHEDRLKALHEIRRVGKNGGFFAFSTHNLHFIDKLFSLHISKHPVGMLQNLLKYLLLRIFNRNFEELKNNRYVIFNDGAQWFRLTTYYIKPEEQIKQLTDTGFRNIRVYSLADGKEITDKSKLDAPTNPWLYYLCTI